MNGKTMSSGKALAAVAAGTTLAAVAGALATSMLRPRVSRIHVEPEGDGWRLRVAGDRNGTRTFATKRAAVAAGRDGARAVAPSELVILRTDGSEQARHRYEAETRADS